MRKKEKKKDEEKFFLKRGWGRGKSSRKMNAKHTNPVIAQRGAEV